MERERFDGADVLHLLLAGALDLDWTACSGASAPARAGPARQLVAFVFVYPSEGWRVPDRV